MVRRVSVFAALIVAGALAACGQSDYDPAKAPKAQVPAAQAPATPEVAPAGTWNLNGHLGKYPNESGLFDTSVIAPDLKTLLGPKLATFKANMQTEGPLMKDQSGVIYTSGNKDNASGVEQAYLLIDPAKKALEVGLWEGGKRTVYVTPGATLAKPKDIQTLIANTPG